MNIGLGLKMFLFGAIYLTLIMVGLMSSCASDSIKNEDKMIKAEDILGNSSYKAICYSGYRNKTRNLNDEPTIPEIKVDLKLLHALGFRIIRTYQSKMFPHSRNTLQAIKELKQADSNFEMYMMLGAWIECEGAFSDSVNHDVENYEQNKSEIDEAIRLAQEYPEIVKIIAAGNESMVHWAQTYFVKPAVVLNWVNYLQEKKEKGALHKDVWITSSDNFASWGGGSADYYNEVLIDLIKAVDYVSIHTYPFHDTHYNPEFWQQDSIVIDTKDKERLAKKVMKATAGYAQNQYESVKAYLKSIDVVKPIHIGESGWASVSNDNYGDPGSGAADEFKQKLYFDLMTMWTEKENVSCFYFEAFDEPWKDAKNSNGSENHFGFFTVDGQAKYIIWEEVNNSLKTKPGRNGKEIEKTYGGDFNALKAEILLPATK